MGKRPKLSDDELIDRLAGRSLTEPPAATMHRARALATRLPSPAPSPVRWLVELLFDSSLSPLPAGVRGAAGSERRLLLRLGPAGESGVELDLLLRRESTGAVSIQGQLVPPPGEGEIEVDAGARLRTLTLSEVGDFRIAGVRAAADHVSLKIAFPGVEPIRIDNLRLPDGRAS